MEYYVISPNVYNDGDNYEKTMYDNKIVAVGWGDDKTKGQQFKSIKKGDCVIVAQRNKKVWTYYYMGVIVDEDESPILPQTLSKKLSELIRLDGHWGLNFEKWSANGSRMIPAVQRITNDNQIIIKQINYIIKMEKYIDLLKSNHNLILTGAPGTGKTYLAKQIAKEIVSKKEIAKPIDLLKHAIQTYNVEERDINYEELLTAFTRRFPMNKLGNMTLDDYCVGWGDANKDNFCYWIETKLKPLGYYSPGSAKAYLLYWDKHEEKYMVSGYLNAMPNQAPEILMNTLASDIYSMVKNNNPNEYVSKFGNSFMLKLLNTYYPNIYAPINSKRHIDNIIALFEIKCDTDDIFERNKVIYKFYEEQCKDTSISPFEFMKILYNNFNIKDGEVKQQDGGIIINGEYKLVQFHPSYDYTDFVEGLRPVSEDKGNGINNNNVSFERRNGVFKDLCVTAKTNPNKNYVMIIDEINRGEINKIFGELFFSIDPDYRGEKGRVQTQYQNLVNKDDEFFEGFFVPENVYIIGTMNDIDRSVESMDFAFRRRFAFKEVTAKETQTMLDSDDAWKDETGVSQKPENDVIDEIKARMDSLNAAIEEIEGLSSAYHIGASYFLKLKNYNGDFQQLWYCHLKGLLFEYLRGTPSVVTDMGKLEAAYFKPIEGKQNDSTSNNGQPTGE